ncbi:trypsin-like peptidase domain-containing protein [Streptomyces sp. KL116D]|uniref:trypsin-like peptidase domain-containing protein n=1 Tax=Streptomyces sp. KL116D TaxID=3045152 RepID=UPI003557EADE
MAADTAEGLDAHRIAEVIVTGAAGARRRGSGYRIGDTAVLTAFHVVAQAADVQLRFDADRPGQWTAAATVAWSDGGCDLAVLEFTPPPGAAPVPAARFGRVDDERHAVVGVHAAGFPLWKRRRAPDGRQFRELHQADGTVAALSNLRTGTLEITVPVAAADPDPAVSPWSGMSGAAVWAGTRIVGVVAEHHRGEGLGRLTAVRVDHALRRAAEKHRARLEELLRITDAEPLLDVGPRPERTAAKVIGLPVTHGLELFKDRVEVREAIGRHLADPAVRMVTVTGRRGMGKSAVAAKVMELLERGEWPGQVHAPAPAGLVNLSTRTAGVSLERIYLDCARVLGPADEARLLDVWATDRPAEDKIGELFAAMGDRLVVVLVDNLEDRLQDDGTLADGDELAVFLDCLFRARATPRLLVTSQLPLRLAPELRRFAVEVPLTEGLPPAESVALLRELDQDGGLGVAGLDDEELLRASVHVHGVPRALELLVGALAEDVATLPTLQDVLADFTLRGDVVAGLAQDRYARLGPDERTVLNVLAVLRTPVPREAVDSIVAAVAPGLDVTRALTRLLRVHMLSVDRARRTFALHPMDADLAYGSMDPAGATGRETVERHAADWYASVAVPREQWRGPDDVRAQRREFGHRVRAGDMNGAALVLGAISEWMVAHGSVLAAISMHLTLEGKVTDDRARLAHLIGLGRARLRGGPLTEAADLCARAAELAERTGDREALQQALFGLGDAYRQLGRLDATVGPLDRAAALALERGDVESAEHALLSLSLAHSYLGDGTAALAGADRLRDLALARADALTEARAWNARAVSLLVLGRWDEVTAAGDEAVRAYRESGIQEATDLALNAKALALLALDRTDESLATFGAALDAASAMQNPRTEGVVLHNTAWAHWTAGDHATAAGTAERAAASLELAGATEAGAARDLAEAARARASSDPRAAADALDRAARGVGRNAELARPAWLVAEAARLRAGA